MRKITKTKKNNVRKETKKVHFEKDKIGEAFLAIEECHSSYVDGMSHHNCVEYNTDLAMMIARVITDINGNVQRKGLEFVENFL